MIHDVTAGVAAERAQAEQVRAHEQRRAAEQSLRRRQQLNAAALAINEQRTVDGVLQATTGQAAAVIGAEQAVVSLTRNEEWAQAVTAVRWARRTPRGPPTQASPTAPAATPWCARPTGRCA